jgi:hypothetical protein
MTVKKTTPTVLNRTTFRTSREMDFFSKKELVTQTGHSVDEWPLVVVKEMIDNALDACEEADIPPAIEVSADARRGMLPHIVIPSGDIRFLWSEVEACLLHRPIRNGSPNGNPIDVESRGNAGAERGGAA